jgi:hypothetical protein
MPDRELHALTSLRRLRRIETDAARRDLGEALARETALSVREQALREEMESARLPAGDFDRETFSVWWERKRAERAEIADAMRMSASQTAAARAVLATRRLAETAADDALAKVMTGRDLTVARKEQATLEDVARALKRAER